MDGLFLLEDIVIVLYSALIMAIVYIIGHVIIITLVSKIYDTTLLKEIYWENPLFYLIGVLWWIYLDIQLTRCVIRDYRQGTQKNLKTFMEDLK